MGQILSARQLSGLNHVGDAWIPGDGIFPAFSALGCAEHVDILLNEMR